MCGPLFSQSPHRCHSFTSGHCGQVALELGSPEHFSITGFCQGCLCGALLGWRLSSQPHPDRHLLCPRSLHKVLFTEQPETYYKWDNWPPESDRK